MWYLRNSSVFIPPSCILYYIAKTSKIRAKIIDVSTSYYFNAYKTKVLADFYVYPIGLVRRGNPDIPTADLWGQCSSFELTPHMERLTGYDPATFRLEIWRSANWTTVAYKRNQKQPTFVLRSSLLATWRVFVRQLLGLHLIPLPIWLGILYRCDTCRLPMNGQSPI